MISGVYQIRNLVDGKLYVGSTNNFVGRKSKHLSDLRRRGHNSSILQQAFNEHGETIFVFEIIEIVDDLNQVRVREQHYLDTLKPQYNTCSKVGGGHKYGRSKRSVACKVCGKTIYYVPNGPNNIPNGCSPQHRSELQRRCMTKLNQNGLAQKAGQARWANHHQQQSACSNLPATVPTVGTPALQHRPACQETKAGGVC